MLTIKDIKNIREIRINDKLMQDILDNVGYCLTRAFRDRATVYPRFCFCLLRIYIT